MNIILFMGALALLLSSVFVAGYIWAATEGQFDDLETPALRILKEDSKTTRLSERKNNEK